ncbi:hypothetical protein ACES2L_01020 [Bdellovibrio bacteriovorus]
MIQDVLNELEEEFINKSAIPYVGEAEDGTYIYIDPLEMDPYFTDEVQDQKLATDVKVRKLIIKHPQVSVKVALKLRKKK